MALWTIADVAGAHSSGEAASRTVGATNVFASIELTVRWADFQSAGASSILAGGTRESMS